MIKILKTSTFRSFNNRNYALYFAGQTTSQIGTWMQRTGVIWVVYTLTHSAFMLGLTAFASQFPSFLFSLLGGIISDRYSRYKILIITQALLMIQAFALAIITLTNNYTVWQILLLSILMGIINAFDVPARQPMVHELVNDKDDLPNAIALNSSMNNLARIIGPALSGIVLAKFGAGICFMINAVSFVAVLTSLLLMKLPAFNPPVIKKNIKNELIESFVYLKNTKSIRVIMLLLTLVCLLVLPYETLLPIFAKVIFNGDAETYGYIRSFIGVGALAGTFFLASLSSKADLKKVLLVNTVLLGIGLALFSKTSYFPMAMVFAVIFGFGAMAQTTVSNTIIQINSDANMRGRVISFLAMAIFGMLPLGSLITGAVSQKIGASNTLLCQGIIALALSLIFIKYLGENLQGNKPIL